MPSRIYDFVSKTIDGQPLSLQVYQDKVLLVVNVASHCGFTPQYTDLETLYKKYQARGLVILGFPCNQFSKQEPGNEADIKNFCHTKYHISFPLFSKIDVNGAHADPLYDFLKQSQPGFLGTKNIKWNFTKFLVDRHGNVIKRFAPMIKPKKLEPHILNLL